jgi:type I restriction-modification system DNA methylase subunit
VTTRHLRAAFEQSILPMHTPRKVIELVMPDQSIEHTAAITDPCSGTAAFAVAATEQVQPPIRQEGT